MQMRLSKPPSNSMKPAASERKTLYVSLFFCERVFRMLASCPAPKAIFLGV
jgi:hypothetical protein